LTLSFYTLLISKKFKLFGLLLLLGFFYININRFFNHKVNKSGYIQRKAVVEEIKNDAAIHGYPCVSVSYITDPGYEFGYRYMFYLANLHVNKPKSESPVYTIVFPLRDDIIVDKTFGALGLIYPDYTGYNQIGVEESCSGENQNLTEPMWGFTN
jgi:hypothetical protein